MASTVDTSTASFATGYPYQRKSFFAAGRHWVFYSNGAAYGFNSSLDGVAWAGFSGLVACSDGRRISIFFDGTYVHACYYMSEVAGQLYKYRRGTPQADGSILWSAEQTWLDNWFEDEGGIQREVLYLAKVLLGGDIYRFGTESGFFQEWTTQVDIGANPAGSIFVFDPYATVNVPIGVAYPAAIQDKGWQYASGTTRRKLWFLDGRLVFEGKLRNPTAVAHQGYLAGRLWRSSNSDMSGATAVTAWTKSANVVFDGTLNQQKEAIINFDINNPVGSAFAVENQYFYIELAWEITVAGANASVQVEGNYDCELKAPNSFAYYPCLSVDSNGYPWIGFRRNNGLFLYPYLVKGDANDGTVQFRNCTIWKLSSAGDFRWTVMPVPLTGGKMLIMFSKSGVATYSVYYDGATLGSPAATGAVLSNANYYSAVNNNDTVELVYLEATSYDIEHRRWTLAAGWVAVATVYAAAQSTSAPVLSIDSKGNLYCFWAGDPTADWIYYKKYSAGSWGIRVDWQNETTDDLTGNNRLTCFYKALNGKVGLVYMTKTASPYNIRYAFLVIAVPPVGLNIPQVLELILR